MPESGAEVRQSITDVLIRYATGIDARDWSLLRSCFTDDCDADYGKIGHWHGADEITAWMAQTHEPLGPTLHRITNVSVDLEQDPVASRCYVHAIIVLPDRSALHAYGFYDDEFVLSAAGPTIARRVFTQVA